MEFDVFIDESGLFIETSTDPKDRVQYHLEKRKFPSQLAGVVCQAGRLTEVNAKGIIDRARSRAGIEKSSDFHATQLKSRGQSTFDDFVCALVSEISVANLKPFRIVNEEAVSFGNRVDNYTNILAELLVRICRSLQRAYPGSVELNVFAARVKLEEDKQGVINMIEPGDYESRIHEYFAHAAVANGWAGSVAQWKINNFHLASGKSDPRLWIADAICNASHDDFSNLGALARKGLFDSLADFNWTLSFNRHLEHIIDLTNFEAYGLAIIALAELANSETASEEARRAYNDKMKDLTPRLFAMTATVQSSQLSIVMNWLLQRVEQRSDLRQAIRIAEWLEGFLCCESAKGDPIQREWLKLRISTALLTAHNHDGNTSAARIVANRVDGTLAKVAGHWEFLPDVMLAITSKAVHQNDCFEHRAAHQALTKVAAYYRELGEFFHEAYPELFPKRIRSDQCGKAIGTLLQTEIALLHSGIGDIEHARQTSDEAIEEFAMLQDQQRQFQYRSELESIAGDWNEARRFIAKSFDLFESSHDELAKIIASLQHSTAQGFAMLHWTRIGGMAAARRDRNEVNAFIHAFELRKLQFVGWVLGNHISYPAHGILRRTACVYAFLGRKSEVQQTLSRLNKVCESNPRPIFQLIQIAATMQCAALLNGSDASYARDLLKGTSALSGAKQRIDKVLKSVDSNLPEYASILRRFKSAIDLALDGGPTTDMEECGASIGY